MSKILKATFMASAFVVLVGAFASPLAGIDYTAVPLAPGATNEKLSASPLKLSKAIEVAEKETGGVASAASVDLATSSIEVTVFTKTEGVVVKFDSKSGDKPVSKTPLPPFPPGEAVSGEPANTASGLMYYDIKVGDGEQPQPTSMVTVHYTGWLIDGKKFDSSVDRGQPAVFPLNRVIRGWTEGVGGMKVGGKRKLIIPGNLAYGPSAPPGSGIPANAILVFDVELLNVKSDRPQ